MAILVRHVKELNPTDSWELQMGVMLASLWYRNIYLGQLGGRIQRG